MRKRRTLLLGMAAVALGCAGIALADAAGGDRRSAGTIHACQHRGKGFLRVVNGPGRSGGNRGSGLGHQVRRRRR